MDLFSLWLLVVFLVTKGSRSSSGFKGPTCEYCELPFVTEGVVDDCPTNIFLVTIHSIIRSLCVDCFGCVLWRWRLEIVGACVNCEGEGEI